MTNKDVVLRRRIAELECEISSLSGSLSEASNTRQDELTRELRSIALKLRKNQLRRERDQVMRDCGLRAGRDSMGRRIWE